MVMTNRASAGADSQTFGGLQLRVAVLCGLIQALDGYDLSAIGLAVPSLTKAWSMPPAAFTQAFALSSVGIMAGAMLAGPIADRFGRKPVLLLSVALFGLFSLLSAWAPSLPILVALRFFTGIGIGGAMPTTVALTSDYTPDRWRTSAVMFMFTGNTIGGFFAGQIAAQILPRWGWQGIFYVGGIVPLVLLVVLIFILPESPQFQRGARPAGAQANPVSGLFADGLAVSTLLIWAIFLINLLNMYLIGYWLPTVLNLEGFSPADAAFAASIYSLGGIMITLLLGPVIARLGAERVLATSLLFGALCIGIVATVRMPHRLDHDRAVRRGRRLRRQPARPERLRRRDLSRRHALDRHRLGAGHRPSRRHRRTDHRRRAARPRPGADHGHAVRLRPRRAHRGAGDDPRPPSARAGGGLEWIPNRGPRPHPERSPQVSASYATEWVMSISRWCS